MEEVVIGKKGPIGWPQSRCERMEWQKEIMENVFKKSVINVVQNVNVQ
jgi:hypothetical protein